MASVYSLFGLRVSANGPIPGLGPPLAGPSQWGTVDLKVFLGGIPRRLNERETSADEWVSQSLADNGRVTLSVRKFAGLDYYRLHYADETTFVIDLTGSKIWASWSEESTLEDTATYLLGPVMGFVLLLRGVVCLHASAIAIEERAIALVGPAGAGKSTTAAAFSLLGYRVLCEDVVPLTNHSGSFLVQPGYPRIRLWPTAAQMLFGSAEAIPLLTPNWDKRYLDLSQNGDLFQPRPLPLGAIYLLGERSASSAAPQVEAVSSSDGLVSLITNTYANYLMDRTMRGREFEFLGRLVTQVPLRRVTPHEDPSRLSELCEVLLKDIATSLNSCSALPV